MCYIHYYVQFYAYIHVCVIILLTHLYSPTNTSGGHTGSVQPVSSVPHPASASGEEYAVTTKATTKPQQQQSTEEYAMVDKTKKVATTTPGVNYIH